MILAMILKVFLLKVEVFEQLLEIDLPSLSTLIIGERAFYKTTRFSLSGRI